MAGKKKKKQKSIGRVFLKYLSLYSAESLQVYLWAVPMLIRISIWINCRLV